MRAFRTVAVVLLLVGCAHKKPPPPPPAPPPPPPKGDLLRYKAKPGESWTNKTKVLIELDLMPTNKKPTHVGIGFNFGDEESVEAVAPDGSMLVRGRLVDAVGEAQGAMSQQNADNMALVFDELKVQFKRQPRGDVAALAITGLRAPLDEATARNVLNAMFGAQRGPIMPETPVDLGGTWKATIPAPETSGIAGEVHYDYTYARKDGGIAIIDAEGRFEGTKQIGADQLHVVGKTSAEYHFDIAAGRMVSLMVDQTTHTETVGPDKGTTNQHLRVERTADKPKSE